MADDEETKKDGLSAFLEVPGEDQVVDDEYREHVVQQLRARAWDDLGVLEIQDRLFFPEKIYRRTKEGKFVGDDCLLIIPRGPDLRRARAEAYRRAKDDGVDPKVDADLFGDIETACILWGAIRSPSAIEGNVPEPLCGDSKELENRYDRPSLMQVNGKLNYIRRLLDPKVSGLSAVEMAALTAAMVARQDLSPLFVCDDATQHSCLLILAALHQACVKVRSSRGSSALSTAGSSTPTSS